MPITPITLNKIVLKIGTISLAQNIEIFNLNPPNSSTANIIIIIIIMSATKLITILNKEISSSCIT